MDWRLDYLCTRLYWVPWPFSQACQKTVWKQYKNSIELKRKPRWEERKLILYIFWLPTERTAGEIWGADKEWTECTYAFTNPATDSNSLNPPNHTPPTRLTQGHCSGHCSGHSRVSFGSINGIRKCRTRCWAHRIGVKARACCWFWEMVTISNGVSTGFRHFLRCGGS